MKTKTYNVQSDPGHAWMKVTRAELFKLNIADKISMYRYQRKDSVYLEEDSDLGIFVQAMKDKGIKVKFRVFVTREKNSKIRSYTRFLNINENQF